MIVGLADTHRDSEPGLTDHLSARIEQAEAVLHAGDFTTEQVLDAFADKSRRLYGVAGNSDESSVRNRLPMERTIEIAGTRIVLTHGDMHSPVSLSLLGRQESASIVVVGHTHRPSVAKADDVLIVNPGSHTEPRGGTAGYVEFQLTRGIGQLCSPDGTIIDSFELIE